MEPDLKRLHHRLRSLMRCCMDDIRHARDLSPQIVRSGIQRDAVCLLELSIWSTCLHGIHAFRAYVRACLSLPAGRHPDILVKGWVRGQARVLLALWQQIIPQPLSLSGSPLTAKCLPRITPRALHTGAQMCVSFGLPAAYI